MKVIQRPQLLFLDRKKVLQFPAASESTDLEMKPTKEEVLAGEHDSRDPYCTFQSGELYVCL